MTERQRTHLTKLWLEPRGRAQRALVRGITRRTFDRWSDRLAAEQLDDDPDDDWMYMDPWPWENDLETMPDRTGRLRPVETAQLTGDLL